MTSMDSLRTVAWFLTALVLIGSGCNQFYGLDETETARTNYHPCECACSGRVIAESGATVFSLPGEGNVVGVVPAGSQGAILDGPRDPSGSPATWWQVRFDAGIEGWLREDLLTPANETLVTKTPLVCLPAEFNPYLGGTSEPAIADLQRLCEGDVTTSAENAVNAKLEPVGRFLCRCSVQALALKTNYDATCTVPCPGGTDVCLVAGSDPPDPTPEPISSALFQPTSLCEVAGPLDLLADGRRPKGQPTVRGTLQVHGSPCSPGEDCSVGMSYQLTGDDIEFDSGTIFASDPKFVDLAFLGATVPGVIALGPFLGFYLGELPAETAFSTAHGRRSTWLSPIAISGRNTEGVALAMNWANATCRLSGELVGAAAGDGDEGALEVQAEVALDGVIVNQPPVASAGPDQDVECTSAAGADVTLDGSGTADFDGNLAFYVWRRGSEDGPLLTAPSPAPVVEIHQAVGQETYFLQAVDGRFAADDAAVRVSVADTIAPRISCNAPATIVPSDVPEKKRGGVSFTATADDGCTGVAAVAIESFECNRPESCVVGFDGATITIYDSGGVGDTIRWVVSALDSAGNESQETCELSVVRKPRP